MLIVAGKACLLGCLREGTNSLHCGKTAHGEICAELEPNLRTNCCAFHGQLHHGQVNINIKGEV